MTTQQLETKTSSVSAPPCPYCGETMLTEVMEVQADLAVREERRLLKRVLAAQEQNRQSLANQILEGLAQRMIGALLRFQAVGHLPQGNPERAADGLREARELLIDSIDEARRIANRLQPPALAEFGIVAAISDLTSEIARNTGLEIEFSHDDEFARPSPAMELAAFRIVQELLNNACRHSQTRKVRVELTRADGYIHVEVRDWGIGFDPNIVGEDGFGLQEARERARLLSGRTAVDSAPGKGTRVVVRLPLGNNVASET